MARHRSSNSLLTKGHNLIWIVVIFALCNLLLTIQLTPPPPAPALDVKKWKANYLDLKETNVALDANTSGNVADIEGSITTTSASTSASTSTSTSTSKYNDVEYHKLLQETLLPLNNVNTAYNTKEPYAGLNNQIIRFTGLTLVARQEQFGQFIEESILWMDTFGRDEIIPHHKLWDVVHWNSFFPKLPRIASYDKTLHPHLVLYNDEYPHFIPKKNMKAADRTSPYTIRRVNYNVTWNIWTNRTITKPQPILEFGNQNLNRYKEVVKSITTRKKPNIRTEDMENMFELIHREGLRPHPFLQDVINRAREDLGAGGKGYMTIHARVEPDMARQDRVCTDRKVWNMTEVVNMIYSKYPEPPITTVLIQFSRALIEEEAKRTDKSDDKYHIMNNHNLQEINKLIHEGMWGGKVKVVEAGSAMVEEAGDPFYKYYSNIAGGIVNLFLAVHSNIFVGTEISTYSTMAANMRYYKDLKENYFYRPDGLFHVTPPEKKTIWRFSC